MADISNNSWEEEDNLNNSPAPNGLPTGENPSKLAPTVRDMRGAIKRSWKRINPILVSSGTASAWALVYEVSPDEYVKGEVFSFFSHVENAGALTLNINGLGAKSIVRNDGIALAAGQIKSGQVVTVAYDGTSFRLLSDILNNVGLGGNLSVGGAITAASFSGDSADIAVLTADTISGDGAGVTNVNALTLETKSLAHVLDRANHTGTQAPSTITGLGTNGLRNLTISTSAPSGGADGDVWYQV